MTTFPALTSKRVDADDGCDISETCLECPISVCRHDPGGMAVYLAYKRRMAGQTCGYCGEPSDAAYCSKEHERRAANDRRNERVAAKRQAERDPFDTPPVARD